MSSSHTSSVSDVAGGNSLAFSVCRNASVEEMRL